MELSVKWNLTIINIFLVCVVKLANFLMFTVSGENTVKRLKGLSWKTLNLVVLSILISSLENKILSCGKSVIKSLMNYEHVLKGVVTVFGNLPYA